MKNPEVTMDELKELWSYKANDAMEIMDKVQEELSHPYPSYIVLCSSIRKAGTILTSIANSMARQLPDRVVDSYFNDRYVS